MTAPGRPTSRAWEFPGVPMFLLVGAVWLAIWPWLLLHGAARYAAGIPWTAVSVLVAFGLVKDKLSGTGRG